MNGNSEYLAEVLKG